MKKILCALFVVSLVSGFSQSDSLKPSYLGGFTLDYGQKFFNDDFNGNLKSINNIESNRLSIETISISVMSSVHFAARMKTIGYFRFSYVLPKRVMIDSVSQNIRGFNLTMPLLGQRLIDKKYFGMFLFQGVQFGRLKLVDESNRKMKNMTIAPYVGLMSKINFSKYCLSLSAQYDYDVSSTKWKKQWFHKGQDVSFDGLRQSGLTFSVGIGRNL